MLSVSASGQVSPSIEQIAARHPASKTITSLFASKPVSFQPSGMTKADYLPLIAANVDFFKQHQNAAGAIIDPYEKFERQYSTPAFALDAALAVRDLKRDDLLEPATRAMSFAVAALANHTTADNHADFYIPMLIHARRLLRDRVSADQLQEWDSQLRGLIPEKAYKDINAGNNWNLVNVCGECLRRKDNLVSDDQLEAQQKYLEKSFASQIRHFTAAGMFKDPNVPLAYDAFPRLWLEDMMADAAYKGENAQKLSDDLLLGGLSTLLLFSPSGEWASGGRSANHQWNEAEVAVISEINAVKWKAAGRNDIAGAFKRMAHLCLTSIKRWQRPSGELWINKNFADPANRHGYEAYSFHSQYNLLAMAMLVLAHERADDGIAEYPVPAEQGSYLFDLRDDFHKVVAAAGGTCVLIDTSADPHYNATGLQRLHKAGVPLSPLSDSAAADRNYGPANSPKAAIAPGIEWQASPGGTWQSQGNFNGKCELSAVETSPDHSKFTLRYGSDVLEQWTIDSDGAECVTRCLANSIAVRFTLPALVSDGATDTNLKIDGSTLAIAREGGKLSVEILNPKPSEFALEGPRVPTHNGWVQKAVSDLKQAKEVQYRLRLTLK
ncbi:MAG TPA: hypothetical protein VHD56_19775 [Tepidisphaeraceae bacterium]|nr:hypothetical protein [Tepidisphaeraceae bacterium]